MTAEVAVLNRSAVALAADSAVTLSDGESSVSKIFQNENKLFELSAAHPVGIMLYNATMFFDVPWETIIKDFRKDGAHESSAHLFEWSTRFRNYIASHKKFKPSEGAQRSFARRHLLLAFNAVMNAWRKRSEPLFFDKQTKKVRASYPVLMEQSIRELLDKYEQYPYFHELDEAKAENLLGVYEDEFSSAKGMAFGPLPLEPKHHDLIRSLGQAVLGRSRPTSQTTGLVFAGFGSDELFPSLISIEISGVLDGKVRWVEKERVDIDRAGSTAEIIPFAQRETVDTLVFERSARYERQIVQHFLDAAQQMGVALIDELTGRNGKRAAEFRKRVTSFVREVGNDFRQTKSESLRRELGEETLDIVRYMPKPDLAAFAESLVTVSSMKRKVTAGPETVGGPVDVAVISKSEGFIWVKRKHYFEADLNRRYIQRIFNARNWEV